MGSNEEYLKFTDNELDLLIRLVENRLNADYSFEYNKILVKLEALKEEGKDEIC